MSNVLKLKLKNGGNLITNPPKITINHDESILIENGCLHGVDVEEAKRLSILHAIKVLKKELSNI